MAARGDGEVKLPGAHETKHVLLGLFVALFLASFASQSEARLWVKEVQIDGGIDEGTLKDVRSAIAEVKDSHIKTLRVNITSPGGSAIAGFAVSRMLRQLSDSGATVEVHAFGLCASACTWILAAGTPGHRYVDRYTLVLVHPLQRGGGFGPPVCVEREDGAAAIEQRTMNAILEIARDLYMLFTGQSRETVEQWLTCGKEQVGDGRLAVALKIADAVED